MQTGQELQALEDLTNQMLKYEQVKIPVTNYFCNGIYARQIDIPADSFITGKIHKHENLAQLVKGSMRLISGNQVVGEIHAPFMFRSPAGTARVAHTLTDCIFITYHSIDPELTEDDLPQIEKQLSCESVNEYKEYLMLQQEEKECHSLHQE